MTFIGIGILIVLSGLTVTMCKKLVQEIKTYRSLVKEDRKRAERSERLWK